MAKKKYMARILLFMLLLPATVFSQNFIGKNKKQVTKFLLKEKAKADSLTITLTDKDSVIHYSIIAGKSLPADFIYGFNRSGRCQSEKITAYCDSCYHKFLAGVLAQEKFGWKKINENQYVSKYGARRMIELPAESNEFTYTILKTNWNKKLYRVLTGN